MIASAELIESGHKLIKRKLVLQDIRAIAEQIGKYHLTETQACLMLGIEPERWFKFKRRSKQRGQFDRLVERFKAIQINKCVATIDKFVDGDNVKRDWRAAAWRAERLNPELRADKPVPAQQTNNFQIALMESTLQRLFLCPSKPAIEFLSPGSINIAESNQNAPNQAIERITGKVPKKTIFPVRKCS